MLGFDIGNSQAVANTVPGGAWLELGYEEQKGQNCEILGYSTLFSVLKFSHTSLTRE